MRTTVTVDDNLIAQVRQLTGTKSTSALLDEVLRYYVQREAARRLAALGGTMPDLAAPSRERNVT